MHDVSGEIGNRSRTRAHHGKESYSRAIVRIEGVVRDGKVAVRDLDPVPKRPQVGGKDAPVNRPGTAIENKTCTGVVRHGGVQHIDIGKERIDTAVSVVLNCRGKQGEIRALIRKDSRSTAI